MISPRLDEFSLCPKRARPYFTPLDTSVHAEILGARTAGGPCASAERNAISTIAERSSAVRIVILRAHLCFRLRKS